MESVLGPASDPRVETEAVIRRARAAARVSRGGPRRGRHASRRRSTRPCSARSEPACRRRSRRGGRGASPRVIRERIDLRDLPLVTIDGETARDFDDAVAVLAGRGRRDPPPGRHRRRRGVRPARRRARRGGAGPRHERLLPRSRDPDAARGALERHLQPESRRRPAGAGGAPRLRRARRGARRGVLPGRHAEPRAPHLHDRATDRRRRRPAHPPRRTPRSSTTSSAWRRSATSSRRMRRRRGSIDLDLPEAEVCSIDATAARRTSCEAERNVSASADRELHARRQRGRRRTT